MIRILSIVLLQVMIMEVLIGQQVNKIQLTIIDQNSGNFINGAVVKDNQDSSRSWVTNRNGFCLVELQNFPTQLLITHLGYQSRIITLEKETKYTIGLDPIQNLIEEVVVNTGYQRSKKEKLTGSYAMLSDKELSQRISSNMLDHLEGNVSGLYQDNRLSDKSSLVIRGYSTIRSNRSPLIILDGAPYEGNIDHIDPNMISNITVLKDASASAIWGARAGNGVVVITTKSIDQGKSSTVNLSANLTLGKMPKRYYDKFLLNSDDFIDFETTLFNEGYFNNLKSNVGYRGFTPVVDLLLKKNAGKLDETTLSHMLESFRKRDIRESLDKHLFQNSKEQQYILQLNQQNEKSGHYYAIGWNTNQSFIQRNESSRLSLIGGSKFNISNWLSLEPTFKYTFKRKVNNGETYRSINRGGIYPYIELDNNSILFKDYNPQFLEQEESTNRLDWYYKPIQELDNNDRYNPSNDLMLSMNSIVKLNQDLSLNLFYNYQNLTDNSITSYNKDSYYVRNIRNEYAYLENNVLVFPIREGGIYDSNQRQLKAHLGRVQINYQKQWGKSTIDLLGGTEVNQMINEGSGWRRYGYDSNNLTYQDVDFSTRFLRYPSNSRSSINSGINLSYTIDRFVSYYFNSNYSFLDRYLLSASVRRDGSNLFGVNTNQRSVPLWSSGVGWLINKESFWSSNSIINFLKIRGTVGYSGNVNKSLTRYSTARYGNALLTGLTNAQIQTAPNEGLRWEKIRTFNLAVDFGFRNDLINGSLEYYQKRSTDLIGESALDPTTGFFIADRYTFIGNNSEMKSQGVDLQLNSLSSWKSVTWRNSLILNWNADKVLKYSGTTPSALFSSSFSAPVEGKPLNAVYSFPWAGLDPVDGSPQFIFEGDKSKSYVDIRSKSTFDDLSFHGIATPVYSGAFRSELSYGSVSISGTLLYGLGHYLRKQSISYDDLATSWIGNSDYSMRWQKPGDELSTYVPSIPAISNLSSWGPLYTFSSVLVDRADYLYMKDVSIKVNLMDYMNIKFKKYVKTAEAIGMVNNIGQLWVANQFKLDPLTYEGDFGRQRYYSIGLRIGF